MIFYWRCYFDLISFWHCCFDFFGDLFLILTPFKTGFLIQFNTGDETQSSGFSGKSSVNRKDHMEHAKKRERDTERVNLEKV